MVSEIQPRQTFSRRPPAHPDTMGEKNTPTALKGYGVKRQKDMCPFNYWRATEGNSKCTGFVNVIKVRR